MSDTDLQLSLMKLLSTKHFPLQKPRRSVKLEFLVKLLAKLKCETEKVAVFENLNELKGRGLANTDPKILMKDEIDIAEFQIWLTPLGRSELHKSLAG